MGSAVKKDWLDRALDSVEASPESFSEALSLVRVVPKVPAYYPPIGIGDLGGVTLPVGLEPMMADAPEEAWDAERDLAYIGGDAEYGNDDNDRAALRQHLLNADDWGGRDRVTVLAMVGGFPQKLVVEGSEAAIRQALPDAAKLAAWKAAGVTEFPVQLPGLEAGAGAHASRQRVVWVHIDQVPTILQMERTWRAATVDAVTGFIATSAAENA